MLHQEVRGNEGKELHSLCRLDVCSHCCSLFCSPAPPILGSHPQFFTSFNPLQLSTSLWHPQVSRGNLSSLTQQANWPPTDHNSACLVYFFWPQVLQDTNNVPSKLAQPEHQGFNCGHVFRCYQRINILKGDPATDTAGKGKGPSDHTLSTLCLTES